MSNYPMTLLLGVIQLDKALVMAATLLAVGSAVATWRTARRARLAGAELLRVSAAAVERRRQELLDFELRFKIAELEHATKTAEDRFDLLASTTASAVAAVAAVAAVTTNGLANGSAAGGDIPLFDGLDPTSLARKSQTDAEPVLRFVPDTRPSG
jgi:hypothetical protein